MNLLWWLWNLAVLFSGAAVGYSAFHDGLVGYWGMTPEFIGFVVGGAFASALTSIIDRIEP